MPKSLSVALLAVVVFLSFPSTAQTPTSDPQALTLASEAQAALGSEAFQDLSMSATAQWIAGGTNTTGTATLKVKGTAEARFDLSAGASSRSEVRNDVNGPNGEWIGPDATVHSMASHNCFVPAGWFAPNPLAQTMTASTAVLKYIGQETRGGVSADHIRVHQVITETDPDLAAQLVRLTTFDVFLDASTHVPIAILFRIHPDNDQSRDIPVEIRFGDYRTVNGALLPFHVQRVLQGMLNLDLIVTSAAVNSGLADSAFALQ